MESSRIVVKRTFIEVLEDAESTPAASRGLTRRVFSDSALLETVAREELRLAGLSTSKDGWPITEFEHCGCGETDKYLESTEGLSTQGFERGTTHDTQISVDTTDVPARAVTSDRSSEAASYESFDSFLEYSAGGVAPVWPANYCVQEGFVAPITAGVDQLVSENARLALENELLRARASLLGISFEQPQSALPSAFAAGEQATNDAELQSSCSRGSGRRNLEAFAVEDGQQQTEVPLADRTTVMLRNVPNNYTRDMLLAMLDGEGFSGCYDFVYLPTDFNSGACLGYAFINMVEPPFVARFWRAFDGYSKWILPSRKVCRVSWCGPHQGLEAHIARYRNSPVMHESVPDSYKPVIFSQGWRVAFPGPTKSPRAPRVRHRGDTGRRHRRTA